MVKVSNSKKFTPAQVLWLAIKHAPAVAFRMAGLLLLAGLAAATRAVYIGAAAGFALVLGSVIYLELPASALVTMLLLLPVFGAVTPSAVTNWGNGATLGNLRQCTIEATADADVASGNIAHGLPFTPDIAWVIPILPQGALKAWAWTRASTGAVNIVFTGNNVVGSGVAGAQVLCVFGRLNTLIH